MSPLENLELASSDIESFVKWRQSCGIKIVSKNGVYWAELKKGFYQPVHLMHKISAKDSASPTCLFSETVSPS